MWGGLLVLTVVLSTSAAAPTLLPHLYLVGSSICFPWRVVSFSRTKRAAFLVRLVLNSSTHHAQPHRLCSYRLSTVKIMLPHMQVDFCYAANLLAMLLLIAQPSPSPSFQADAHEALQPQAASTLVQWMTQQWRAAGIYLGIWPSPPTLASSPAPPHNHPPTPWEGLAAAVLVIAEGPLAAALLVWRCSWQLGSPDHSIRWGISRSFFQGLGAMSMFEWPPSAWIVA